MTKIDKKGNFLDLVPERNCRWDKTGDGRVCLLVPRFKNRWMKKIALKLGKSETVKIHFDDRGTAVWDLIDGSRTVEQIGQLIGEKKAGDDKDETETMDRVYARLTEFLSILSRNRFIQFKNY
jgi:hypothetical protein